MTSFQAIVMAFLQGLTELFPISSLGHAVIFPRLVGWGDLVHNPDFLPFLVVMHLGTAIALFVYFWRDWVAFLSSLVSRASPRSMADRRIFALVVLATMHIVAQHFVVHGTGGLRTYHQVLQYLSNPVFVVVECAFLLALVIHAMLGLRSILLDFDLGPRTRRHLSKLLWGLGTVTFCYGAAVVLILASR